MSEVAACKTVLVVDDQPGVRRLMRRLLELEGYAVVDCEDGDSAIRRLPQLPPLACALLDLTMPSMDGLTLSRVLQQQRPNLPVIFMSGYDRNQVLQADMVDDAELSFLEKPFTRAELMAVINATAV